MKKKYLSLIATALMFLGFSSCSQEEPLATVAGEMTTFKISLEGKSLSRSAGDGDYIDNLYYEVYQGGTKILDNYGEGANADPVTVTDGVASVDMPLLKGEKYKIMFWAQKEDAIYTVDNLQNITVEYTDAEANQEAYDAFFYGDDDFQATSNVTTIELRRPFGQLRIGTTVQDWTAANNVITGDDAVTHSSIKVKGLAKTFNVLTGKATDDAGEVIFKMSSINKEYLGTFTVKKDGVDVDYKYLSMNYLLVPSSENVHKSNLFLTATFRRGDHDLFNLEIPNVTVERNWRTNIMGNLLAADKTFEVIILPGFDGSDYNYPNTMEEKLRMTAATGGTVTLTEDVALSQTLNVQHDMTINLNGKNITVANESNELGEGDGIIVTSGKLTINGEGTVKANTRAVWARGNGGAEIVINGGTYVGATTAGANSEVIYASGNGKISIYGGSFEAVNQSNGFASPQYAVLNLQGNGKTGCDIKVYGGKFKNFNPADNISENPKHSFVAEGYEVVTKTDGTDTWYSVIGEVTDIILHDDHAEVYTAEGLLEFVNIVNAATNHEKNGFGLQLMQDIVMPLYAIEKNANGEYVYTDTPITFDENGVPSGSNWVPICGNVSEESDGYNGCIDGNGNTISNVYINRGDKYTGLVGFMYDNGIIKDLTIANSVIKGVAYTGIVGGRSQHGSRIENVHVVNSKIMGTEYVGGIVGYNYRRHKVGLHEELAYVKDCTTDKDTKIEATDEYVGGICGCNYGAVIVNCVNNADVTGKGAVGGIAGYSRDYWANGSIIANTYVIACESTDEALVKATNGSAGGIIGTSLADNQHVYTKSYVVACHSASDVEGNTVGAIIGKVTHKSTIVASWAEKKGSTKIAGVEALEIIESALYEKATDITEDIVGKMNDAITSFNTSNAESIQCEYKWEWVNGSWPKLVLQ